MVYAFWLFLTISRSTNPWNTPRQYSRQGLVARAGRALRPAAPPSFSFKTQSIPDALISGQLRRPGQRELQPLANLPRQPREQRHHGMMPPFVERPAPRLEPLDAPPFRPPPPPQRIAPLHALRLPRASHALARTLPLPSRIAVTHGRKPRQESGANGKRSGENAFSSSWGKNGRRLPNLSAKWKIVRALAPSLRA